MQPSILVVEDVGFESQNSSSLTGHLTFLGFNRVTVDLNSPSVSVAAKFDVVLFSSSAWAIRKTSLLNSYYQAGLNILVEGNDNSGHTIPWLTGSVNTTTGFFYPVVQNSLTDGVPVFERVDSQNFATGAISGVQIFAYGNAAYTQIALASAFAGGKRQLHMHNMHGDNSRLFKNAILWTAYGNQTINKINIDGSWKSIDRMGTKAKIGGTWRDIDSIWVKTNGV